VHDLIPLTHPEYCRPAEREKHVRRMNNALDLAAGIVTNSEATRQELMLYAAQNNRVLPPTEVALLARRMRSIDAGERRVSEPYFVMLSTIEPRKNHWLILQIWCRLIERLGPAAPRLVVIGQRGWECENVVDLLERCEALCGFVTEISDCSDESPVNYLCHAQALLFPSFAEGYGMPVAP
jgi:glycosyltransferase involved in cell wall biosynthesis